MAEPLNRGGQVPNVPPPAGHGGVNPHRAPQGVGGDRGGMGPPPPKGGIMDLVLDIAFMVRNFLRALHKSIFFCQPVQNAATGRQRNDGELERFLKKWFPETIELLPGDSKEVMIQELGKLDAEDFKLIVRAFNEATRQNLDEGCHDA